MEFFWSAVHSEFLLCLGQWLGEAVFASEQFSHPHAAFLSAEDGEHTFLGGIWQAQWVDGQFQHFQTLLSFSKREVSAD